MDCVGDSVEEMESYMEMSEKSLDPSQLRKMLKHLPGFLKVCTGIFECWKLASRPSVVWL